MKSRTGFLTGARTFRTAGSVIACLPVCSEASEPDIRVMERSRRWRAAARRAGGAGGALAGGQRAAQRLGEQGDALGEHLLARDDLDDLLRLLLAGALDVLEHEGARGQGRQQHEGYGGAAADGYEWQGAHLGGQQA